MRALRVAVRLRHQPSRLGVRSSGESARFRPMLAIG